ncbi:hypothetical protein C1I95_24655 [Micromonospora craterilacus]|uniref:DUF2637 domain-containing protein n=1 Tax=Micromonospora craterilacus TaxID=1655439 RepID=A0A2W2DRZ3_9ACTN|nr:hypothetical protein [Micromonospora craterilacus]PZG13001.1 hypothetical protein C1I95_24655 [Micromonospora craterilacus]
MNLGTLREPLPGDDHAPAADDGPVWWQHAIDATGAALDAVPGWTWLTLAGLLFVALVVMRHRLDKALRVAPPKTGDKLGGLFIASVVLAGGLWGCILAASATNLLGFARDTLDWRDGHDWLIVGGIDGIAVLFAVLMFAAAKAGRPTHRSYRIVWSSTLMSAGIGVWHGYGSAHSLAAAVVLGYFAVASMGVLHELLDLFRSTSEKKVPRVRPPFGLRWITYLPNTAAAALAWENHPPRPLAADASDEQIAWYGSVRHAVQHLETVRRAKRIRAYQVDRYAGAVPAVGWARLNPWLRVRQLNAALAVLRRTAADELATVRADVAAELARVVEQAATDRAAAEDTAAALRRQVAELNALLEIAAEETQTAEVRATAAERQAATADEARRAAEADATQARLDAARRVAAAEQTATITAGRADRTAADLDTTRELVGQLRQQTAAATAAIDRATAEAADLRQQLAAATAAAVRPVEQQVTQQRPAVRQQQTAGSSGKAAVKWPTTAPWHPTQQRAFELRDSDRARWTWQALSDELGETVSAIRRWFDNRGKPTLPIDPPATPTTAVNGTPVPA